MDKNEDKEVQETINLLLNNNELAACDDTHSRFNDGCILPPYYSEEKFQRGQQFFHKHIFGMLIAKLLGLITVISTPDILSILVMTKMTSEPMPAFKRYMATILHMSVWYKNDFKPGSDLWNSIAKVKTMHNSASKKSCTIGKKPIQQKDMGITQFGFIGFIVARPELVGIYNVTEEEMEGFIHLWKVIGYIMGMEDRFNICKKSTQHTRLICEGLIQKLFIPNIRKQNPQFLKLADALLTGMWVMQPMLQTKTYLSYLYFMLEYNTNNNENKLPQTELNGKERFNLALLKGFVFCMKYTVVRWYANAKMWVTFWLMKYFPFLVWYKYGYENSRIEIFVKVNKK